MESNYKKGDKLFVLSGHEVKEASFVSRSASWNYVEFDDGSVIGYPDKSIFPKKSDALEELVDVLKNEILSVSKKLLEKLPIQEVNEIKELIEVVKKLKPKDK